MVNDPHMTDYMIRFLTFENVIQQFSFSHLEIASQHSKRRSTCISTLQSVIFIVCLDNSVTINHPYPKQLVIVLNNVDEDN